MADVDLSVGAPGAPSVAPDADEDARIPPEQLRTLGPDGMLSPVPDQVTEAEVRNVLRGLVGPTIGLVLGDPDVPKHWRFTDEELDELTPPFTRYANRNAGMRALIAKGDEGAILVTLAHYTGTNVAKGNAARRARRAREHAEEAPDAGEREAGAAVVGAASAAPGPGGADPGGFTPRGFPRSPS